MCSRFKSSVLYAVSSVAALIGAFVLGATGAQAASCSGVAALSMDDRRLAPKRSTGLPTTRAGKGSDPTVGDR